ncbi:hypothetical protein ACHAPC_011173 [Botrytis cinerea]
MYKDLHFREPTIHAVALILKFFRIAELALKVSLQLYHLKLSAKDTMPKVDIDLDLQASKLLDKYIENYDDQYGAGSMTTTIYDTAWVSMITKTINGDREWLFLSSFTHILDSQRTHGGWDSYASDIDGILNTAAALLSLLKHHKTPYQLSQAIVDDLPARIKSAGSFLKTRLEDWDLATTQHVAFEILVPNILDLLEQHGEHFNFGCRDSLMNIRDEKLAKIPLNIFYTSQKTSALHSLEGFVGRLDFDKLSHHKVSGSMMGSPSSTAAYLMYSSKWDVESEEYIRRVINVGAGNGDGSVPSAFPSHLFEVSWAVSTMLDSGFSIPNLGQSLKKAASILEHAFSSGAGLIGFAPLFEPDADDTAKGIVALDLLGKEIDKNMLVDRFGQGEWFKTYRSERDASFSTNCNVLKALTCSISSTDKYRAQIEKVMAFLCHFWLNKPTASRDKWNLSSQYSAMLVSQALIACINAWANGALTTLSVDFLKEEVLLVLFQALLRTLQSQKEDGSWERSPEVTAYAVFTIKAVMKLPLFCPLLAQINSTLEKAEYYISDAIHEGLSPGFLWVEKVTYNSSIVSNAYLLSALKSDPTPCAVTSRTTLLFDGLLGDVLPSLQFYERLPMFRNTPRWRLQAYLIEGLLYSKPLRNKCNDAFPIIKKGIDKHLQFVPFTWTGGNNEMGAAIGHDILLEMMAVSAIAFDIDKLMESQVASLPKFQRKLLKNIIKDLFDSDKSEELNNSSQGRKKRKGEFISGDDSSDPNSMLRRGDHHKQCKSMEFDQIVGKFRQFAKYYMKHPETLRASIYDQEQLRLDLLDYLLAHLTQINDNADLREQDIPDTHATKVFHSSRGSFFDWIRSTSGNHTAGPFAFSFFLCLFGPGDGRDSLETVEVKYIAQDVSRHLASMCRLYNDWGSVLRDRDEDNLNSIQFPEFGASSATDEDLRRKLFNVAEYERRCLENSLADLKEAASSHIFKAIKVFCHTADMYGQMYVLKDLTPRIKKS